MKFVVYRESIVIIALTLIFSSAHANSKIENTMRLAAQGNAEAQYEIGVRYGMVDFYIKTISNHLNGYLKLQIKVIRMPKML